MFNNKKIIAIIPARSGSKGLKDKNIKPLNGKPLIAYTIEAAKNAELFDEIIVSTDSEHYAQIAKQYGAKVPFLRSEHNSTDKASSWEVVKEVLSKIENKYDIVILLQRTWTLRTSEDIIGAKNLFFEKDATTVCSVCETEQTAFWSNTLGENQSMLNFIPEQYRKQRQCLPVTYSLNGAIYIIKTKNINNLDLYSNTSYAYIMDKNNSVDIDNETDFLIAQVLIHNTNRV